MVLFIKNRYRSRALIEMKQKSVLRHCMLNTSHTQHTFVPIHIYALFTKVGGNQKDQVIIFLREYTQLHACFFQGYLNVRMNVFSVHGFRSNPKVCVVTSRASCIFFLAGTLKDVYGPQNVIFHIVRTALTHRLIMRCTLNLNIDSLVSLNYL